METLHPTPRRIKYVALYQLQYPAPAQAMELLSTPDCAVTITTGPISITHAIPLCVFSGNEATASMGLETLSFDGTAFIIISILLPDTPNDYHATSSKRVSEIAIILDLFFPQLIAKKNFEGIISSETEQIIIMDGPICFSVTSPHPINVISDRVYAAYSALMSLSNDDRERFQLASRWFRRGHETLNYVDRLLFWYITLEIYPAQGSSDVPRCVRDILHSRVYADLDASLVKERCGIGPIAGLRAEIVHTGRVGVTASEEAQFANRLDQLEGIVRTCLRLLAGMEPGDALDRWLRPGIGARDPRRNPVRF